MQLSLDSFLNARRRFSLRKPSLCLASGVLAALACNCGASKASAQAAGGTIYYWDGNGAAPGAGTSAQCTDIWEFDQNGVYPTLWGTSATGNTAPGSDTPGSSDLAVFTAFDPSTTDGAVNPTGGYTVTMALPEDVYGIVFGPTTYNGTASYVNTDGQLTLAGSGSPGLTLGAGGVTLNDSSGDPTFAANIGTITLDADQTWNINNGHVIATNAAVAGDATPGDATNGLRTFTLGFVGQYTPTFSGVISDGANGGKLALVLNNINTTGPTSNPARNAVGGGTWSITGTANTYTGGTTLNAGILQIASVSNAGSAGSLGSGGTLTMGSGTNTPTLNYNGNAASTTNDPFALGGTTGGAIIGSD